MTKTCNKCHVEKPLDGFAKDARRKDGLNLTCRDCRKAYISARKAKRGESSTYIGAPCKNGHKGVRLRTSGNCVDCLDEWRQRNKEKLTAQVRARYWRDPEKAREAGRTWRKANPGWNAKKCREYAAKHPEKVREQHRKWREANRERLLGKQREYWWANRERLREANKQWRKANAEKLNAKQREAYGRRRQDAANVERDRSRSKKHYEVNRGYYAHKTKARRAIEKAASPAWLTAEDRNWIEAIYAECAEITKRTGVKHEVDHIVPLQGESVSGLHVPWNLQILTAEQNRSKGHKHADE